MIRMKPSQLFRYTKAKPPATLEFSEIGKLLVAELSSKLLIKAEIINEQIEPLSWVTNKVLVREREKHVGICYFGVVSYSLRETIPSITSVLMMFNFGLRVKDGLKSILVSKLTESKWETFVW